MKAPASSQLPDLHSTTGPISWSRPAYTENASIMPFVFDGSDDTLTFTRRLPITSHTQSLILAAIPDAKIDSHSVTISRSLSDKEASLLRELLAKDRAILLGS